MHIEIMYETPEEKRLAFELQTALFYGHEFGTTLAAKLENDVDITIVNGE